MNRKSLPRCTKKRRHFASGRPISRRCSCSSSGFGRRSSSVERFPTTHPTATATRKPRRKRPPTIIHSVVRPRYATNVDARTTGFRTGAASMNVIAAGGELEGSRGGRLGPRGREPPRDRDRTAFADREREPGERRRRKLERPGE